MGKWVVEMFNLIGNNCLPGFIYKNTHTIYNNPFMWNVIDLDDLCKMMEYFDEINWFNVTLREQTSSNPGWDNTYILRIDDLIDVHYIHDRFDPSCNTPVHKGVNVHYNCIWEYLIQKYFTRLKRMLLSDIKPIFVAHQYNTGLYEHETYIHENMYKFIECKTKYTRVLFGDASLLPCSSNNCHVFEYDPNQLNTEFFWHKAYAPLMKIVNKENA